MSAVPDMDDDDVATTLMDRAALPPASGTRVSVAHSEPPRDTVVDPLSPWSRARAALEAAFRRIGQRLRRARLSDRLPPLPPPRSAGAVGHDERGELLLLDIMRADPAYQDAAVYIAHYALALRKLGGGAYAEGLVHFALSRMQPDADGFVSTARLRDRLSDLSYSGTLVPALVRLETAWIVTLTATIEGPVPRFDRVQLRVPL